MDFPAIFYTRTFWAALGTAVATVLTVFGVGAPYSTIAALVLAYLTALFLEVGIGKIGSDSSFSILSRPMFWSATLALASGVAMAFGANTKITDALGAIFAFLTIIFVRNTGVDSQAAVAAKNGEELRLSLKAGKKG